MFSFYSKYWTRSKTYTFIKIRREEYLKLSTFETPYFYFENSGSWLICPVENQSLCGLFWTFDSRDGTELPSSMYWTNMGRGRLVVISNKGFSICLRSGKFSEVVIIIDWGTVTRREKRSVLYSPRSVRCLLSVIPENTVDEVENCTLPNFEVGV